VYPRNPNEEEKRRKQQKGRTSLSAAAGQRLGLTAYTDPYRPSYRRYLQEREKNTSSNLLFISLLCIFVLCASAL
jgi:hypothetical protein